MFWLAKYRPYPMVILSGIMLILAFPPFPFAFLIYFAFVPLLLVIDQTPSKIYEDKFWGFFKGLFISIFRILAWPLTALLRIMMKGRKNQLPAEPLIYKRKIISHNAQVFRYAYISFFIWNVGCCYWLTYSPFGNNDEAKALIILVAGCVALLVNPFLMTIPVYFYTRVRKAGLNTWSLWAMLTFWVSFEWLHMQWELAWPWLTLGYSMSMYPALVQYVEITGILGVSIQIILVNLGVYLLITKITDKKWKIGLISAGLISFIGLPLLMNIYLLNPERELFQSEGTTRVRVVQPNLDPYLKYEQYSFQEQIEEMDTLASQTGIDSIDILIFPETAIPKPMFAECMRHNPLVRPFWREVYVHNLTVLTGFHELRYFPKDTPEIPPSADFYYVRYNYLYKSCHEFLDGYYDVCNSVALLRSDKSAQTSQKNQLVPLIEAIPFSGFMGKGSNTFPTGMEAWQRNLGKPDTTQTLVTHDSIPLGTLISYDGVFGDHARKLALNGAKILVILTNDGWWGNSSGPVQHAHMARIRAIETRRTIVRAANAGISMVVDQRGNILKETGYGEVALLDEDVPIHAGITYYARHGDYLGMAAGFGAIVMLLVTALLTIWHKLQKKIPLSAGSKGLEQNS